MYAISALALLTIEDWDLFVIRQRYNEIIRQENVYAVIVSERGVGLLNPEAKLRTLVNVITGEPVDGQPETMSALNDMTAAELRHVLDQFGFDYGHQKRLETLRYWVAVLIGARIR